MLNVFRGSFFCPPSYFFCNCLSKISSNMSYHPDFFCRPAELMIHIGALLPLYKYPMIQSRKMAWNLKHCTLQKKVVKSSSKCLFWSSKSRFSQRGVTVFQPCMLMLKGFLWLMVQVSEMFLSHDIQMRQARPWRPRHRPCLFDNTAPPGVSFGNLRNDAAGKFGHFFWDS